MKKSLVYLVLSVIWFSCSPTASEKPVSNNFAVKTSMSKDQFHDYWYQGKAEITSYDLEQARYGEIHNGSAVMIFVTEDFSKSKKVKLDNPSQTPKDAVPVLKLNATRKFNTGIYPYSMMNSVFTPVDYKKHSSSLKVSSSSQEWCGHTFMQLSEGKNHFSYELDSYFESEGTIDAKVEKAFLEDEIWTRIRIEPKSLPTGDLKMLPGAFFARLRHIDYQVFPATATLTPHKEDKALMTYKVKYSGINRSLKIHFDLKFPYQVDSWEEEMTSGFGPNAKTLITRGTRKKSLITDYWTKHNVVDLGLRKELELED